jgi:tripartite-type tricarboxylate transporter receptor subunit TctC
MIRSANFATATALFVASQLVAVPVGAVESPPFFAGKTLRVVVGFSPGGGYDLYARQLGRYLGSSR